MWMWVDNAGSDWMAYCGQASGDGWPLYNWWREGRELKREGLVWITETSPGETEYIMGMMGRSGRSN